MVLIHLALKKKSPLCPIIWYQFRGTLFLC